MVKKGKYHLVASGDSLFGPREWACGGIRMPGLRGDDQEGVFGSDGTLHMVTCRKCIASQLYREMCVEQGVEHPFSLAAKKAWRTMRGRDVAMARTAGRFGAIAEEA